MTDETTAGAAREDATMGDALRWQARIDRGDVDWDGYTAWLEADSSHREAIDAVDAVDVFFSRHRKVLGDLIEHEPPHPAPHISPFRAPPSQRRHWPLIAAAIALLILLPVAIMALPESSETYRAGAASPLAVALDDGSRITLAQGSEMDVAAKRRAITLVSGAAYFDIRHSPDRALTVAAGDWRITDIGTRFGVNHAAAGIDVAVAEGAVTIARQSDPARAAVTVTAGRHLSIPTGGRRAVLAPIASADVASWRFGRLTYDAAPIAMVANDIGRYLGKSVEVDRALADRRFSGTLIGEDGEQLIERLQAIMAIDRRDEGDRIILVARSGA